MPTYEYACNRCGIVEVFQSIREDALTCCPQCKSKKIERLISGGAGVIFKGDGFWETDYNRSDDYRKQSKSETGAPGNKGKKDSSAGDSPTTKTQSKPTSQDKSDS
jgi:putative FmdB family regulatory protein